MNIYIKQFNVDMEIKNNGVELDVCNPQGEHIGDLVVTKTKLIWCQGKTSPKNGVSVNWQEFIDWMNS